MISNQCHLNTSRNIHSNRFGRFLLALAISLLVVCTQGHALDFHLRDLEGRNLPADVCAEALARGPGTVRLADEENVIVTAWNIQHVKQKVGRFEERKLNPVTGRYYFERILTNAEPLPEWKFASKQQKLLDVGKTLKLEGSPLSHFLILPETGSLEDADALLDSGKLKDKYRVFRLPGNDMRDLDIAIGVRADLALNVELRSHAHAMWNDPIEHGAARVFTRDLPVAILRDSLSNRVQLILIGNHAKSLRDRAGGRDQSSKILRTAQFQATERIIASYLKEFGENTPIILAGDFNTDVRNSTELLGLKQTMTDAFELVELEDRITHTYHPKDGPIVPYQLDAIMVSPSLKKFVKDAVILPEFDHVTGKRLGMPRTKEQRDDFYPSDHRAISTIISGKAFAPR